MKLQMSLLVLLDRKPLTEEEMDKGLSLLKGRQLLKNHDEVSRTFGLTDEGKQFNLDDIGDDLVGEVTPEGSRLVWKEKQFQRYSTILMLNLLIIQPCILLHVLLRRFVQYFYKWVLLR